jgi:3-deoxy-7-phosphoheptulonate synthase
MQYPDIAIVGEITLRVVHCLIVHPDAGWDTIKTVRSHPQALAQCKVFLDSHPDWVREAWSNTAVAVGSIPPEGEERLHIAAIASDVAARLKGLKVLREGIETNSANYTRFCVISRKQGGVPAYPPGPAKAHNKASVVCSIKDEPGSLYSCLQALTERKINLSKIESRPIHGQPWHYRFYLDGVIPPEPGVFEAAIEALKAHTEDFHLLGSYRAAE